MRKTKPLVTGSCAWVVGARPSNATATEGIARVRYFRLAEIVLMMRSGFMGIIWLVSNKRAMAGKIKLLKINGEFQDSLIKFFKKPVLQTDHQPGKGDDKTGGLKTEGSGVF